MIKTKYSKQNHKSVVSELFLYKNKKKKQFHINTVNDLNDIPSAESSGCLKNLFDPFFCFAKRRCNAQ